MKQCILAAYIGLFITFAMSFLGAELDERAAAAAPKAGTSPPPAGEDRPEEKAPLPSSARPAPEKITVRHGEEIVEMDLEEYVLGVLAAEMPAEFEAEALKAQAVAARTYTLYCAASGKHDQAQVCTDFACCQAWKDEERMRSDWGAEYDKWRAKLSAAVDATAGQQLVYEGAPVFAAFHSSSAGRTESCGAIWGTLPYLVSVDSPEDAGTVPNYISQLEISPLDFRDTLLHFHPEADFSTDEKAWIGETVYEDSGRVDSVRLGGISFAGTKLREIFALRSTAFTLEYTGSSFLFTVTGYGHGIGMSQYGANVMAAQGSDYRAILAHYYPGTQLVT